MKEVLWTIFGFSVFAILLFGVLILRQIVVASELSHRGKIVTIFGLIFCIVLICVAFFLLFFALSSSPFFPVPSS